MTTYIAFQTIHTPENNYETDKERRTWGEATWFFKKDRRKRLSELQA